MSQSIQEWRPYNDPAAGTLVRDKQVHCAHSMGYRLTSPNRRMYCGLCDVDFRLWQTIQPPPDRPTGYTNEAGYPLPQGSAMGREILRRLDIIERKIEKPSAEDPKEKVRQAALKIEWVRNTLAAHSRTINSWEMGKLKEALDLLDQILNP